MSIAMYPRRVYYEAGHGAIRCDDVMIALSAPPRLPGSSLLIEAIDYAPGVIAQLRECGGAMREMTAIERAGCDEMIAAIAIEAES